MLSLIFGYLLQGVPSLFNGTCPTQKLKNTLKIARQVRPTTKSLSTKKDINTYLQSHWKRQDGTERNELRLSEKLTEEQKNAFKIAFKKLSMIDYQGSCANFNPVVMVILGGNYLSMQERIAFTKKLIQSLQKTPVVLLLTGDRYLEKIRPDRIKPLDDGAPETCKTEQDAGQHLINQNQDFAIYLLNSPKQAGAERATTVDNARTLKEWLIEKKVKGKVTLISTEPHGPYQLMVIQKNCKVDGVDFDFRAVLLKTFDEKMFAICMDALARMVYTEVVP